MSTSRKSLTADPVSLRAGPCHLAVTGELGRDAPAIARQLGAVRVDTAADPELTLHVGTLPPGPRRLLGRSEYAAQDEGLVILRGPQKRAIEFLIPFDELGGQPRLQCRPGSAPLPLLVALVNLSVLARGVVPVHAAAFDLDGLGVLVTGWSKSGKTETLLAMASRGARYIGDEWVYLDADGFMSGLPEPMRLWSWHLRELDGFGPPLPLTTRAGLALLDAAAAGGEDVDARLPGPLRRARHVLDRQRSVRVPPEQLLPISPGQKMDVVVLVETHDSPEVTIEPVESTDVAARIAAMLPAERHELTSAYEAFRYAFPYRRSELLDSAPDREQAALKAVLADRPALLLRHPYPFRFEDLARALEPQLDALR
jgi:hypothetical protein